MNVDPRFLKEDGCEVFSGNELLVKGLLETEGGTHLWTGYPGSPVAGFFDCVEAIKEIPLKYGIEAALANNEALSAAMVNGSQMSGLRGVAVMKSVGLHVAADALALGNLAGAHPDGGAVIICGDDPWNDSTQAPADSRFLCKHLFMPVLEPGDNQEMKDWLDLAFKLSRESELYIGYLVTTNQADGGGSVLVKKNQYPAINTQNRFSFDTSKVDFENKVLLPPRTARREVDLHKRFARLWAGAKKYGVNRTILPAQMPAGRQEHPIGFITSALASTYLEHALYDLGIADQIPILKLGITYPLDPEVIKSFAAQAGMLIVVEERRPFLEEEVALILSQAHLDNELYGKAFPFGLTGLPSTNGLNASVIMEQLGPLLLKLSDKLPIDAVKIQKELDLLAMTKGFKVDLTPRTPTFCPGCPHRDSSGVLNEIKTQFMDRDYMQRRHRREPVDLVFHGDTGCAVLLMFEPNQNLMHNYSGMGLAGGTGMGIDPFITNKQLVLLGDSTFFHSGQAAISNSIKNGQDITYIILDNKTTAMTGHQPTPGNDVDIMGKRTFTQNIEEIIQAMVETQGVEVIRTNPAVRDQYRALLEETILKPGVKVLVADKECGITYHRKVVRAEREEIQTNGFLREQRHINVTLDVCEYCLECTKATGCPGLTFVETDFGRKVQTDLSWCVADTACTKIHACPSFEEVTIVRSQKPMARLPEIRDTDLPAPTPLTFDHRWYAYLAGVGGMGVGVSAATLVHAGHEEGYEVNFCDKIGLAIRNGPIYSEVTFRKAGQNHTCQIVPYGKSNLLIGIDALEAARGLNPAGNQRAASPLHTGAVINSAKAPTIATLTGKTDFCIEEIETIIRNCTRSEQYFSADISAACERAFGTKIYVNIVILGIAYQLGRLPLSLKSLEYGIKMATGAVAGENLLAFKFGRKMVVDIQSQKPKSPGTWEDMTAKKSRYLKMEAGDPTAAEYEQMVKDAIGQLKIDPSQQILLAERIYDLICYENANLGRDYVDRLVRLHKKDSAQNGFAATAAALWNMHRVIAIKDEVYVAQLLTRQEKYERDRERYNVNAGNGDEIIYRHLNRPEFDIGPVKIRFKLRSQQWMLKIMRRMKFLRRLLPAWHRREKAFRDWYLAAVEQFQPNDAESYRQWLTILRLPEEARGYREVRYPEMDKCRERGEAILKQLTIKPSSLNKSAKEDFAVRA